MLHGRCNSITFTINGRTAQADKRNLRIYSGDSQRKYYFKTKKTKTNKNY